MFVRRATSKDIVGILECLYQFKHDELDESNLLRTFRHRENSGWQQYVCIEDHKIVGTFSFLYEWKLYKNQAVVHLEDVATHPAHHHKGVGTHMMNYFLEFAVRPANVYKVILNCDIDKVPFYEHNGFRQATVGMRFDNNV